MKKEFISVFQMSKTIYFEVNYYTLNNNSCPHFATRANQFARNKRDLVRGGQAQRYLLPGFPAAMAFFQKWDSLHLHDLTDEKYAEMMQDLEILKERYHYLFLQLDESKRPYNLHFGFEELAEWSKQTPKPDGRAPVSSELFANNVAA